MTDDQIATEAWNKISDSIDWWTQQIDEKQIIAIIKSAIEKGRQLPTDED